MPWSWLGFAAGLVLIGFTWASVIKTFMVPRETHTRINAIVSGAVYGTFRLLTARVEDLARRERILAVAPPIFLLGLLASWLVCLWIGFALLLWPTRISFLLAMRESGSSLFTLGFAFPHGIKGNLIVFVTAASGLAVLALLISYMPLLYAAFNRRETLVASLEALAGAPPWGAELLARQALIDNTELLPSLYGRWTDWAADISESHVNYRTLIYFRSLDSTSSWLLSLLAVLDGAALHLSLNPSSAPHEARPLMRVGYLTMRSLAATMNLPVDQDPRPDDPIELTRADFDEAVRWLHESGWQTERLADDAWPHFHAWRVNYEAAAYKLAFYLDLPPALWSGPRRPGRPSAEPPLRPADRKPGLANLRLNNGRRYALTPYGAAVRILGCKPGLACNSGPGLGNSVGRAGQLEQCRLSQCADPVRDARRWRRAAAAAHHPACRLLWLDAGPQDQGAELRDRRHDPALRRVGA